MTDSSLFTDEETETHREEVITARIKVRSEHISKPKLFYNTLPPSINIVKMPVSSLINRWPTGPRQPQVTIRRLEKIS